MIRTLPIAALTLFVALAGCDSREPSQTTSGSASPGAGPATTDNTPLRQTAPSQMPPPSSTTGQPQGVTAGDTQPRSSGTTAVAMNPADQRLLSILHHKDQEEIRVGQLAQQKATSSDAKAYADMLVNEHSDHAKEVMTVAQGAGITLLDDDAVRRELQPAVQGTADPVTRLQSLSGAEFDREFGRLMMQGHRDLIRTVETAMPTLKNEKVRNLAEKTLPVLRHHEERARAIAEPSGTPASN